MISKKVALSFLCGALLAGSATSWAQERKKTFINVDEGRGVVEIIIDGQSVVQFGAEGIRVNGNVEYSGMLVDTGADAAIRDGG